jgi:hypothetical protein
MDWIRVNAKRPCPVCHKPDWCTITEDGTASCCMRVESARYMRNGGWLHRLSDPLPTYAPPKPPIRTQPKSFAALWAGWRQETAPTKIEAFASKLGVTPQSLDDLGAAWAWRHSAWAFPMLDGAGTTIGIRLRSENGRKWSVSGSHQGLFTPMLWVDMPREALICEGPTDTAAGLSLGFLAIGRPSCLGCEAMLPAVFRRIGVSRVVIVSDNDGPGKAGALKLASSLRVPWKIIVPPCKDLRAWVISGASRQLVETVINQQIWRIP